MSDLWARFQGAVHWVGENVGNAAIAVIGAAHVTDVVEVLPATSVVTSAPTLPTDGIDIRGVRTIDIGVTFGTVGEGATLRPYLYCSQGWFAAGEDLAIVTQADETTIFLNAFDVESWQRMALRVITAPTTGTVQAVCSPEVV